MNHRGTRRLVIGCVAIAVIAGASVLVWNGLRRYFFAPAKLHSAYASFLERNLIQAETDAWEAYSLNNRLTQAALLAAQVANENGRYEQASQYAEPLISATDETRIPALRLLAQLAHHRTYQLSQAERTYRLILTELPEDVEAQTGLANLLGLCGRRAEAIPLVLNLVRQGAPSDLLMLLSREDTVVNDSKLIDQARTAAPHDPLPMMAQAWHAANGGQFESAIDLLRRAAQEDHQLIAGRQLILRYLAAAGRFEELRQEVDQLRKKR